MKKVGFDFPQVPRKTALFEAEENYQKMMAEKLDRPYKPIHRSNFGQYDMAVNYITSVLEEAKAVEKVAVYNIDHMAQIEFSGKDAANLLDRVLPANIKDMRIGQCKYTLLLTEKGTVVDDMIIMKFSETKFVSVINAGHDITDSVEIDGQKTEFFSDADLILRHLKDGEDVTVKDISEDLVKVDVQGPFSYKLVASLYGKEVLRNRNDSNKNMGYFTFNEFSYDGHDFVISRTGYTNRWGWEMYIPVAIAVREFNRILDAALDLGGLLVGLGGRDENRISAGNAGLPLNGSEYDQLHTPVNAPLFNAAIDLQKSFFGKEALVKSLETDKRMVIIISEGIVVGRGVYLNGKRLGTVTSSINSPNISQEKREFIGSQRKSVNGEEGTAAIGVAWLYHNPYQVDEDGNDIVVDNGEAVRIKVEFYKEDENKTPSGKPVIGYISGDGVNPPTAPKALKAIEKL
ncbi:MAG: aminomethyl transferase family protein [Candidatus Cloacimonetes bacterium]|nr:aminomethyl transferase family protein [Candidatus Cloacimonadota bacterium]